MYSDEEAKRLLAETRRHGRRMKKLVNIRTVSTLVFDLIYLGSVGVFLYYLARAIQANRILGLVFNACLTLGLAVFLAYGIYDSHKTLMEVEKQSVEDR